MSENNISPLKATEAEKAEVPKGEMTLHRIYTKGNSFEAAAMTLDLLQNTVQPKLELQIGVNFYKQGAELHEAVLTINATAKHQDALLWKVQLQQAGLYTLKGFNEEQLKAILIGFCMSQLYPYAALNLNQQVTQGGFSTVYLQPVNFEELLKQQLAKEKEKKNQEADVSIDQTH
jgi:preprotein translocase subunit SecB